MKQTLTLLGVLVALIAVIMVSNRVSATREKPALFNNFDKAKVTKITIVKYGSLETLKLENKKWLATQNGDYPADTVKIGAMLTLIAAQKKDDPVSKNPAKHAELKVDSANATKIILEAGAAKWTFYIGSMAQGFSGNYMRFDGKNEVYASKGSMDQAFSTAADYYRDKALFKLTKEDITEFSVAVKPHKDSTVQEFSARFNVEKAAWKIEKPAATDGDGPKINEYLMKFCGLEADEWYDKDTTTALGFDDPMVRATLKKADGSSITLLAGAEKNGSRYVKVEGDANKYLLRSFKLDGLKPNVAEMIAKPPAPDDPTAAAAKPTLGFPQGK